MSVGGIPCGEARRIFIVGSGRSGTSLLRTLLNLDPQVALAPETHFLDQWLPRFWGSGDDRAVARSLGVAYRDSAHLRSLALPDDVVGPLLAAAASPQELFAGLLDAYARQHDATCGGEKTAAHFRYVDRLLDWFPDARVVFMVRDPRAVVASLVALDAPWAQGTTRTHAELWRAAAAAALRWRDHPQVDIVRFEDLVADPEGVLQDLAPRLLGRPFDPKWIADRSADVTARLDNGSLLSNAPVDPSRASAWRDRLRPVDEALVARACRDLAVPLGYPIPSEPVRWRDAARYAGLGATRQAERVRRAISSPRAAFRRARYRRGRT